MKITFVFPGQGTHYPGMEKSVYDEYEACRQIYNRADEAIGRDITKLCF